VVKPEPIMGERRTLGVGDVQLYVESFGSPADPTLLLVAGAAASMDWWDEGLCRRLAAGGRHVVRYDHRDTGQSTTGRPGTPAYGGWQLARDCLGLVEALDTGPVHLVGLSMGGGITQWVALHRPDLVSTLTLASTTAVGGVDAALPGPAAQVLASFAAPLADPDWADADSYADWTVAGSRIYAGTVTLDEQRVRETAVAVHARSHDVAAAGNHWLVVGRADEPGEPLDVRRIAVPTLVVHGSEDPLFPLPHGAALTAAVPDAHLLVLPGVGHEVPPPATWEVVVPRLLRHTR
jgi:pimeloyl-ACP methyl ester carboxylesterase